MSLQAPVVYHYQQALDAFRRAGESAPLLKRMSELVSLVDFTTTLGSGLAEERVSEAALLLVMGELQVSRGGLLVREEAGGYGFFLLSKMPTASPKTTLATSPKLSGSVLLEKMTVVVP